MHMYGRDWAYVKKHYQIWMFSKLLEKYTIVRNQQISLNQQMEYF